MPTYDYECSGCGSHYEMFQSIKDRPARKCPKCGALKAKRLIGAGGAILFKGSGFYTTDYRSDDYKKRASADKAASTPAAPKTDEKKPSAAEGGGNQKPDPPPKAAEARNPKP